MPESTVSRAESRAVIRRSLLRVGLLAAGSLLVYALVFDVLDPPPSYSCAGEPPPDAAAERADFLPPAVGVIALASGGLLACAWSWAAHRRQRRDGVARPGQVALWLSATALLLWAYPVTDAATAERTGGALFYAILLGAIGLAVIGILAVGLALHLALVRPVAGQWPSRADSMTTAGAWMLLLFVAPAYLVLALVAGTDATIWC